MATSDSPKQQHAVPAHTIRAPTGSEEFRLQLDEEAGTAAPTADEPALDQRAGSGPRNPASADASVGGATVFGIHRFGEDEFEEREDTRTDHQASPSDFEHQENVPTGVRDVLQSMDDGWLDAVGSFLQSELEEGLPPTETSAGTSGAGSAVPAGPSQPSSAAPASAITDSTDGAQAPPGSAGILRRRRQTRTSSRTVEHEPSERPSDASLIEEPPLVLDDTDPPVVSASEQVTRTVDVASEIRKQRTASAFVDTIADVKRESFDDETRPLNSPSTDATALSSGAGDGLAVPFGLTLSTEPVSTENSPPPVGTPNPPLAVAAASALPGQDSFAKDAGPSLSSGSERGLAATGVDNRFASWGAGSWVVSEDEVDEAPEAAIGGRRERMETPASGSGHDDDQPAALFAELQGAGSGLPLMGPETSTEAKRAGGSGNPVGLDAGTLFVSPQTEHPLMAQSGVSEPDKRQSAPVVKTAPKGAGASADSVFALVAGGLTILACLVFLAWVLLK